MKKTLLGPNIHAVLHFIDKLSVYMTFIRADKSKIKKRSKKSKYHVVLKSFVGL